MSKKSLVLKLVVGFIVLTMPFGAWAQARDIDFDWLMSTIDRLLSDFAPGITVVLAERDNDGNGIWEEDTLAMLSSVLRGGTRVDAPDNGLSAADITQIQADFAANRNAANNDMAATGLSCFLLGVAGYPCRLTEILVLPDVLGPRAGGMVSNLLLDYVAGMATIADTPATFTTINNYLYAIIDAFCATQDTSMWSLIRGLKTVNQIGLNSSNYQRWGAAGSAAPRRNAFGAAGNFDNVVDTTTNVTEYTGAGFTGSAPNTWRDVFLTGNWIIPTAFRITNQPVGTPRTNHIASPTMEDSSKWTLGANWTLYNQGAANPTGPFMVLRHTTGNTATARQTQAQQAVPLVEGTTYRVQFSVKFVTASAGSVTFSLGTASSNAYQETNDDWHEHTFYLTATGANPELIITPTSDFDGYIDNVSVKVAALAGDYLDMGTVAFAGGVAPFTLLWEDARNFPGDKDYAGTDYELVNIVDGTPGPGDTSIRGSSTYHLVFEYLLPSHDGMAPWLRNSDTPNGGYTSSTVYNPPNPTGAPPAGCIESDALGGRTTVLSMVQVGPREFAVSPQPASAHKFVGESVTFTSGAVGGDSVPTYQWYKDGNPVGGQTGKTLTFGSLVLGDAGDYILQATNLAGSINSNAATLEVANPLQITTQPVGANRAAGDSYTFTVAASGGFAPLSYQWYHNPTLGAPGGSGNPVGGNSTTLALSGLVGSQQGTYSCVATDKYGNTATSNGVDLRVLAIQTQPAPLTRVTGQSASFTVTMLAGSGLPPYTYQWRKNGIPIGAPNNPTYTISQCVMTDDADYSCLVTDSASVSLLSSTAHLTVTAANLNIDTNPVGGSKYVGDSHTFSVVVSGGSGFQITYQWEKDGSPLGGATDSTLTLSPLVVGHAGAYRCVVGEVGVRPPAAYVNSSSATLNVEPRIGVVGQPVGANKAVGGSHTFSVVAVGGYAHLTYQWYRGATPVYSGQTYNIPSLIASDQGNYYCRVSDSNTDTEDSNTVTLTVLAIQTSPADREVQAGNSTTFTVVVLPGSGTGTYFYQWRKDGGNITNATNASYTISSCLPGDEGDYDCRVTDSGGAFLYSAAALLTVTANPINITSEPLGGDKYVGDSHTFSCAAGGGTGTLTYQWQKDGSDISGATDSSLTLGTLTLGDEADYQCMVGDDVHPPLAKVGTTVVTLNVRDRISISEQPTGANRAAGGSHTFQVTASGGYTPLAYEWYRGATLVYSGGATYNLTNLSFSDQGTYRCVISDANIDTETSADRTLTVLEIQAHPAPTTVNVGDPVSFSVTMTPTSGLPPYSYQWRHKGADIVGATDSSYSIASVEGGSPDGVQPPVNPTGDEGFYWCIITDSAAATLTTSQALLVVNSTPLSVTENPVGAQKYVGGTHTFHVAATGGYGPAYTYQWVKDGAPVSGQTTDTLTVNPLSAGDAGAYKCLVGEEGVRGDPPLTLPWVESAEALLEVEPVLTIDDQPEGAYLYIGETFTTSVAASGGYGALSYQWSLGGTPLPGATDATYSKSDVQVADVGSYRCTVTDGLGTPVVSDPAALTVAPPVDITVQPLGGEATAGQPWTFTVTAVGGKGSLHYAWTLNGNPVGTDSSTYFIPIVTLGLGGTYQCTVTDSETSSDVSLPAFLTVQAVFAIEQQPESQMKYVGEAPTFYVSSVFSISEPTYQWYFDRDGAEPPAAIPGATNQSYTFLYPFAQPETVGDYWVVLTDDSGTPGEPGDDQILTSDRARLDVAEHLEITGQPQGGSAIVGDSWTFTVAVTGGFEPLTYEWFKDGGATPIWTGPSLTIPSLVEGDTGNYTVVVRDGNIDVQISSAVQLIVLSSEAVPAAGVAALGVLVALGAALGASRLRRRK